MNSTEILKKLLNADSYSKRKVTKPNHDTIVVNFSSGHKEVMMTFTRSLSGWTPKLELQVSIDNKPSLKWLSTTLNKEEISIAIEFWEKMDNYEFKQRQTQTEENEHEIRIVLDQALVIY